MFKKIMCVVALTGAAWVMSPSSEAKAFDGVYRSGFGYGYAVPGINYRSVAPYRPSSYRGVSRVYGSYYAPPIAPPVYRRSCPPYRYGSGYRGIGGYGYGYGVPYGYGRSGVSLRIGF